MNGNAKKNPIFAARAVVRLFSVPVSVWILFIFFFRVDGGTNGRP